MNFKFTINPYILFASALTERGFKLPEWKDFRNHLWKTHNLEYKILQGDYTKLLVETNNSSPSIIKKASNNLLDIFNKGMGSSEFKKLLSETEEYKKWLENEWLEKRKQVEKELTDILRIPLPKDQFTVIVFHPKLAEGRYLENKTIAWGHIEEWPNYSIVYLSHEFLHEVFGRSKIEHAIIELATDNELRIRLSNGGDYFYVDDKPIVHEELLSLEKKILPLWLEYLEEKEENAFKLIEELKQNYKHDCKN